MSWGKTTSVFDCNLGLGNFKDSIERMEAAIAYLKR
jgi:hypothetical protein